MVRNERDRSESQVPITRNSARVRRLVGRPQRLCAGGSDLRRQACLRVSEDLLVPGALVNVSSINTIAAYHGGMVNGERRRRVRR